MALHTAASVSNSMQPPWQPARGAAQWAHHGAGGQLLQQVVHALRRRALLRLLRQRLWRGPGAARLRHRVRLPAGRRLRLCLLGLLQGRAASRARLWRERRLLQAGFDRRRLCSCRRCRQRPPQGLPTNPW